LPERGEGSPRRWDPRWRKFGAANYVLTGVGLGVATAMYFVPATKTPWQKRNGFDEWGRRTFGVRNYDSGQWAQDTSDLLLSMNLAFPLLVDSLVVGYWYRRSPEVAGQTALITLETLAVATMLQSTAAAFFQRERPYGRECGKTLSGRLSECADSERYRSYFSGHTTMGFAAAGVTCSHHAHHDLFGDSADPIACGVAFGSAAAVGMMRVVALKHYLTDVLTGAAVGTLSGVGIPWLLHYGPLARVEPSDTSSLVWGLYPLPNGIAVGGRF
jgi:membrane-associated phospholipid phosphatase